MYDWIATSGFALLAMTNAAFFSKLLDYLTAAMFPLRDHFSTR